MEPLLDAQHQSVMEAQYREHMGREMAKFVAQRTLKAGLSQDRRALSSGPLAPLTGEAGARSRESLAQAPAQGALGYSAVRGRPSGGSGPVAGCGHSVSSPGSGDGPGASGRGGGCACIQGGARGSELE